ncbi:MAG: hypothetical protein A2Z11_03535 [Candidatus Woykebacteria bacterium RBG_16_43_9]|uniref:Endolytic murein transglycosylase n=1 Tax=Candidatus Woykebacteria bacterium RBG_16_43_9 TaxID=1802596 RepID=A0A1G1WCX1_9BACT|nr:MAG: hypothetical protein A2Z11_03535 [Candidatus Woykebacteria bacterium RBG_16_43_9]
MRSSWTVKQSFGSLFKFLTTLFIIISIPLVTITIWVNWALSPVSEVAKEKTFVIKKDESSISFSRRLQDENLIKNAFMFRVYLKLTGLDKEIQAGSFKISPKKSVKEVVRLLTTGRIDKWVTFVEGLRKEEVAQILEENFEIDTNEFLKEANEGELFPDTYLIPVNADTKKILSIFKSNLDSKFDESLQKQAKINGFSKKEVLIMASIVERESRSDKERPIIAGILIKRWKEGLTLGADATVQYAVGYSEKEKTWWRKVLTEDDLKIDSSYNTRSRTGLPPEPICSPGLASIDAVLTPKESPYYFYLHDKKGQVHYAITFEEHQENINKYLQ